MLIRLAQRLYDHLILPFQQSHAPVTDVSWGAAIGMLIAMTPTVGAQMYIAALVWVICRYVVRFRFNLPIAIAMSWITNPVTTIPVYYVFLKTGDWALFYFRELGEPITYAQFKQDFLAAINQPGLRLREKIVESVALLFWDFGWPIVVGSLFWAIPLAILTYPVTALSLHWYRRRLAAEEGLSYEEWTRKHVFRGSIPVEPPAPPGPSEPAPPRAPET